jgi:hypothetical protein
MARQGLIQGPLSDFLAFTTLETSLALIFDNTGFSASRNPNLGKVLLPSLRCLVITDDLYDCSAYFGTVSLPTIAIVKRFITSEQLPDSHAHGTEPQHVNWVKAEDAIWRTTTPEFTEFVFNFRGRRHILFDYWRRRGRHIELRRMCEDEGINCSILYREPYW